MKRLTLLAAVLLLSGCGIPATGVIQSGDPATGVTPAGPVLYFVVGGHLVPTSSPLAAPSDTGAAVKLLLSGPDVRERRLGMTTALDGVPAPAVSVNGAEVTLRLSAGTRPLPPIAIRQLICTAAAARLTVGPDTAATGVTVVVTGPDGRLARGSSRDCVILRPTPLSTETAGR
ncbi:hypothetical protein [Streptacidiphilus anmyonensis]|uniref:hypothetical protein n=1 Tax=Streptacidiphilus anmyonensis TaxID=405782 RepID=UPI0005AA0712|nr:hypothetical protein [Streptacidiphilus anmyonensis]